MGSEMCIRDSSTTLSFSPVHFLRFASSFVDPGLVVSVVFSPVIIVPVSFDSVLGKFLRVSLLSLMTDFVILILTSVPCVNVVVSGNVYGAVVAEGDVYGGDVYGAVSTGGGHVNIPTFLELQIRSLTEVQDRKIMQSSVSNSKQRTKQYLAIKKLGKKHFLKTFNIFRKKRLKIHG